MMLSAEVVTGHYKRLCKTILYITAREQTKSPEKINLRRQASLWSCRSIALPALRRRLWAGRRQCCPWVDDMRK